MSTPPTPGRRGSGGTPPPSQGTLTKMPTPKTDVLSRPPSMGMKKSASTRFAEKNTQSLEKLPSFREVTPAARTDLFIRKLNQCCLLFDFADLSADTRSKEIKREALLQSVEYLFSSREAFNDQVYKSVVDMVSINLFRPLAPRSNPYGVMYDPEEDEPILEAAWPHIQIVYELFLRFIDSPDFNAGMAKNFIDQKFVTQLLELFDSEDPRERDYLKTTLHRIYGKFLQLRSFIRTSIRDVFCTFVYETGRHNGVAEILEVLGSIINGYAVPLRDEHRNFLTKVLLPLHKPKSLTLFQSQLTYCITQFVDKEPSLALTTIKSLVRMWPVGNSPKQVLFLNELEEIINVMDEIAFRECCVPLFKHITQCFRSDHFQVAERALYFWSNDHIVSLVAENVATILPLVYNVLFYNSNHHWHKSIRGLSFSSLKLFLEIDPGLYAQCAQKYREDDNSRQARAEFAKRPQPTHLDAKPKGPVAQVAPMPDGQPPVRRKSLLPVDAGTLELLSTHRSLEDVIQQSPVPYDPNSHLQGEGEIVDLNAPYSDDESDGYSDDDLEDSPRQLTPEEEEQERLKQQRYLRSR
eukprot:TRINITY_DN2047_c0_g1_i1.p1 TRINITY_DN2047_c0_g1~~TRINITY_DN2047_c0_g1_i1.p1  ORF type:complete len:580 (-),score=101.43 TRINITY_DN2047_c0_g1_i1:87-1826(-)